MNNLVPHFIIKNFENNKFSGKLKAVVMFIDIAGFTAMTQKLMKNGREGAEILTDIINNIFTPAMKKIYRNYGFVSTFAGDAFTAIFPLDKSNIDAALSAAIEIQKSFQNLAVQKTKFGTFKFNVKIGLSKGKIDWHIVNSKKFNNYYFKGQTIYKAAECEKHCKTNQIVVDDTLTSQTKYNIKKIQSGFFQLKNMKKIVLDRELDWNISQKVIERFIPRAILRMKSLGEFRNVVSCFLSLEYSKNFQENLKTIIKLTDEYGGYFNKIDYGDKGYVILILFGAPLAKEMEVRRACDLCIDILKIDDFDCKIGISYGLAFAGFVGSEFRREYTALGMSVNRSARLMMKADRKTIYHDENVFKKIKEFYKSKELGKTFLKGFSREVKTFQLVKKLPKREFNNFNTKIFARKAEIDQILNYIDDVSDRKFDSILYISGLAGSGKTRLSYEIRKKVLDSERDFNWLAFACDPILRKSLNPIKHFLKIYFNQFDNEKEKNENYFKSKFNHILTLTKNKSIKEELLRTRPFIKKLIQLDVKNTLYESLDAKARYQNTIYGIVNLIKALSLIKPVIIHIEDANSIDADSLYFLKNLTYNIEDFPIGIIVNARREEGKESFSLGLKDINEKYIELSLLSKSKTKAMCEDRLAKIYNRDIELSEKTFKILWPKMKGNPFYIEQTIDFLYNKDLLDDKLELKSEKIEIPTDISSLIIAHIDKLDPGLKQVTKIASVLGQRFTNQILSAMLNKQSIEKYIDAGIEENLWLAISELDNVFKNTVIRECVYNLILKKELRDLHKAAAESIEEVHRDEIKEYFLELAYNYEAAEIISKTIYYLEKAGDYEKKQYHLYNAMNAYKKLLGFLGRLETQKDVDTLRLRIKLKLIEIFINLGKIKAINNYLKNINISGIEHQYLKDKYYFLKVKRYVNTQNYLELQKCMNKVLGKIKTEYFKKYMNIYYLDALLYTNSEEFEKVAANLKQEYKDDKYFYTKLINNIGKFYVQKSKYYKALEIFSNNLQSIRKGSEKVDLISVLHNIGVINDRLGNREKASEYYHKALKEAEQIGQKNQSSRLYTEIANVNATQNKMKKAIANYKKSLEIARNIGNRSQESLTLYNLAKAYYLQRKYELAMKTLKQSIDISKKLDDLIGISYAHDLMGDILFDIKKYKEAEKLYHKNLKLQKNIKDREGIAHTLGNLGNLAKVREKFSTSKEYYLKQIEILTKIGDKEGLGKAYFNLAMIFIETQKWNKANMKLQKALSLFVKCSLKTAANLTREQLKEVQKKINNKSEEKNEQN